jgi:hypothetical protein
MHYRASLFLNLVLAGLICACGGGGGGSGSSGGGSSSGGETSSPAENPAGNPAPAVDHTTLAWDGAAGLCLPCHTEQAKQMYASAHYQWQGEALYDAANGPLLQGKISDAFNSYCINILGNWNACGSCHAGLGAPPVLTASPTDDQLKNIDCLICHQRDYKRVKVDGVFVPDAANMTISLNQAVQTVHRPDRSACLSCHAKAGGGDAVKRGDLALASAATNDRQYDVHLSTAGADLNCLDCHTAQNHRIAGRGSDLRETDLDVELTCTACHTNKAAGTGHATAEVNRHVGRVACQTCHIPTYAKDAADTPASEATETHRTWKTSDAGAPPYHPSSVKANNLTPKYRFWNRYSTNYRLGEAAQIDPATGAYPTSRPDGDVNDISSDNKLYPFKYKTAEQPLMSSTGKLIALDTSVYFATADADAAIRAGLANMGHSENEAYSWVTTDTLQLLNHQVSPAIQALDCSACHGTTARVDLKGELGYGLKAAETVVCSACHGVKANPGFTSVHRKHVTDKQLGCQSCHTFSRPERNLK